ncbi:hypothetical protein [Psychromonas sp. SR45-3]|uniref:hypothetical protein n=1 Tax=Psychromonas sp. SR45-3 TaxID=2760930 RepID=UPI0015F95040|nr:hypothetical protein [Psychromonas sp. SR45-3]MBB1272502.1 hypothetical protein [Psychromonas sp. SR45-3]
MTETDAYLNLFLILGTILTLPFVWSLFIAVGKFLIVTFLPPKDVTFEIKLASGEVIVKKVNIENNKELINAILSENGRVIS